MTLGYGISGIGYDPLGNIGLGMSGQFASYDSYMPSMLGMNYGMANPTFGMNPMLGMNALSGMNGMTGLMGGYPMLMAQMQQVQNQIEASQAQHSSAMHNILLNNEVTAHRETDSALMKKMLTNGDIQQGIQNLYAKVREGDQDGICTEFDKLKTYVYTTYADELAARGDKINPSVSATQYIEAVYASVISRQTGEISDLRSDIKRWGDGSLYNGFMSGFTRDHHKRYVDETLNHCFGLEIDHKGSKDLRQDIGNGIGRTASVVTKGLLGAAGGIGATGVALGLGKLISFGKLPWLKCMSKTWKPAMALGAIAGIVGDIIWQTSKS